MGEYDMPDGKVNHIEGNYYCVEKYYKEYTDLMKDSKRFLREFKNAGFKEIKKREFILDHNLSEKEFRESFVDVDQDSDPPGYRFMIRVYLEEK